MSIYKVYVGASKRGRTFAALVPAKLYAARQERRTGKTCAVVPELTREEKRDLREWKHWLRVGAEKAERRAIREAKAEARA